MTKPLPNSIWILGFVSLLMDVSSEMIHSILPLFLVASLGVSVAAVGLIEGIAESTALIVKLFSGALSDYFGKRKPLAVLGYSLGAISKPLFAIASGAGLIIAARFIDRIGKGIRGAPRDALVADLVPPAQRGAAFGLRQSLDTVGASTGPLIATVLMIVWANDFRAIFWVAVIPAFLAVALLIFGIKEPVPPVNPNPAVLRTNPLKLSKLRLLSGTYWWVVAIGIMFTLARFSEAFLVLRAAQVGIAMHWVPLVMVAMNILYALTAYPVGMLSDRFCQPKHRSIFLLIGLIVLVCADLVLAKAASALHILIGVGFWGLHMGITQGLLATMVAQTAPADLRGTAFGFFNFGSGIAMLFSSVIAGLLWDQHGAAVTFYAGAIFAFAAMFMIMIGSSRIKQDNQEIT